MPRYEYRMHQAAPELDIGMFKKERGNEAAQYLEKIANKFAGGGWEFYRIDPLTVSRKGCLGALLPGLAGPGVTHYVLTFRRLVEDLPELTEEVEE